MDSSSYLLSFVVVVLLVMFGIIGTQVFFILKVFRKTLEKINKVLDDTGLISESISKPISMLSTMLVGIKGGSAIMKLFEKKDGK